MKIKISDIKISPGRRKVKLEPVAELAKSIAAVGLLNPITVTEDCTLVAGPHRLEAAKRLGWTEIKCAFTNMSGPQLELAEIDENIVRTGLTRQELGEQLSRRKELYETLHPETKAGAAQAAGMNRAVGNNVGAKLASTPKSFIEDTAEKTGLSNAAEFNRGGAEKTWAARRPGSCFVLLFPEHRPIMAVSIRLQLNAKKLLYRSRQTPGGTV